jgi:hypothetical protein
MLFQPFLFSSILLPSALLSLAIVGFIQVNNLLTSLLCFLEKPTIWWFTMLTRLRSVLWNRNYFLRFRFLLLKRYGSGSDFWKIMVPVPTFEKFRFRFRFRFQLHIYTIKSKFFFKNLFPFYIVSYFTRKKIININKFIVKCERKKCKMKVIKYIILYLVPVPQP